MARADLLSTPAAGPAAVRGGGLRGVGFLVGSLASAGSAALLFHHLGRFDTGRYVLIVTLVGVIAGISDLGLTAVGVRDASAIDDRARGPLLRELLGLRLALTLLGLAILIAVSVVLYTGVVVAGVAIAGTGLALQVTQDNYTVLLQVGLRFGQVALLEMLRQILTILFFGLLVVWGAGLLGFVAVSIAVGIACAGLAAWLVRGRRSLWPAFHWSQWGPILMQILPYSAAVALAAVYFRIAVVLVSLLGSGDQLGLFGSAFRVLEFLTLIPALLASTALPILARAAGEDRQRLRYALTRVFEVSLIVGVWIAVSLCVGASLVIAILGGHEFASASPVLRVLGVALLGTFLSTSLSNGLLSLRRHRALLAINGGALVLSAALVSVLVKVDGALGAAIGVAVGELGAAFVTALVLARAGSRVKPSPRLIPAVALAAGTAIAVMMIPGIPTIARLVISTAVYAIVILLTGTVPAELAALLPDRIARRLHLV